MCGADKICNKMRTAKKVWHHRNQVMCPPAQFG